MSLRCFAVGLFALAFSGSALAAPHAALRSTTGMVVSAQHLASDVGAKVLKDGGNAVDAAVAVGYALAVTHPCCGNLGGGGFMLLRMADGRTRFINFRERAPAAATADMYLDAKGNPVPERSLEGWLAAGVPGTVLGLETARREFGTMSRQALIAPAIRLANEGFVLTPGDAKVLADSADALLRHPAAAAIFLRAGRPYAAGERLVQKDLSRTLRDISAGGAEAFYHGAIAAAVVKASHAGGGLITAADFANYTVTESAPVTCGYRGFVVLSAPPPSSGGVTLCEMLEILGGYPLSSYGYRSPAEVHDMTEAMRLAYRDRNADLGDPAFVSNPVRRLTSPHYAAKLRAAIASDKATPSAALGGADAPPEGGETTHYSIADRFGNVVSVTYTINDDMGGKVVAPGVGFLMNDEMDDFTAKPGSPNGFGLVQGAANAIAPGKRPLSSMAPTILLKDNRPVLVVGSPGGARIITTVLEIIVAFVDHHLPLEEAVDAPRFHQQWLPDTLAAEPGALTPATTAALRRMGYKVVPLEPWGTGNAADAIAIPRPGMFIGANDARAPAGSAAAP